MKTNISAILGLSLLVLIVATSFASAAITFTVPPTLAQNGSSATITIQNNNLTANPNVQLSIAPINTITFSYPSTINVGDWVLVNGDNYKKDITITPTIPNEFDFILGELYSTDLIVKDSATTTELARTALSFGETKFCKLGDQGNLSIAKLDIVNNGDFGEKDEEWYPFDNIEVTIKVENNGNERIDNVVVKWGLYNPDSGEWVIDEEEKEFDLKADKTNELTLNFQVNPEDLDVDVEDYVFYAKAYSDDSGEDAECTSDSTDIQVIIDNDLVILSNIKVLPEVAQCGGELNLIADVWNIGSDDQSDVYVEIVDNNNGKLGINKKVDLGDIDAFDSKKLNVNVPIPEDATEGNYNLVFTVYDEDDNVYESETSKKSDFVQSFKIEGNCGQLVSIPSNLVEIVSGGKAGQEIIVKASIVNNGKNAKTLVFGASGQTDWATLSNIEPATLTLNGGESKDVLFKLNVNKDAEGDKTFSIEVTSDNKQIIKQPVQVTIQKSGFTFPWTGAITGIGEGNWYLWAIGALNVILILIIIVVAVRVAKS